MLYRMRRSCLMPPSMEETDDPFQHVVFFPFLSGFIFINLKILVLTWKWV